MRLCAITYHSQANIFSLPSYLPERDDHPWKLHHWARPHRLSREGARRAYGPPCSWGRKSQVEGTVEAAGETEAHSGKATYPKLQGKLVTEQRPGFALTRV